MQVTRDSQLRIPKSLRRQLLAFRRRVWCLKMFEAVAAALIGVLVGFLLTFVLDRFFDTPRAVRSVIFAAAMLTCAVIPMAVERWMLRRRTMDQIARLLSQTRPSTGDQLLGIIELAEDNMEQSRSPALVEAAIAQVAADVQRQDLRHAIPRPQHKQRAWAAAGLSGITVLLLVLTASAAQNAWARFLAPWKDTPRYTFAAVKSLPDKLVVPHGESFEVSVGLQASTQWEPASAEVSLLGQPPQQSTLVDREYRFELPPQITPASLHVKVGDFRGQTAIEPMLRPELSSISATLALPEYLGRTEPQRKEIRGATMSVVKGSRATLTATASRDLTQASVNGRQQIPDASRFSTDSILVEDQVTVQLEWKDQFGLSGKQPFELTIEAIDDEPPSVVCENLPRRKVLLHSEVLSFQVRAHDDFGVKKVGIQWQGLDNTVREPAAGETLIGAGNSSAEFLALAATFSAAQWNIPPQPVSVRVFVEDFLPGRQRVYGPPSVFEILSAEQHAIWISSQLTRWHRMSLDVRDREMQLHETNRQLQTLPPDQLGQPETRQRLTAQAQQEQANGRQLSNLVRAGEGLLKEAMRNSEIGADHLEKWAEMMQVLKDIAGNRMPSVAELLKQAAEKQSSLAQDGSQSNSKESPEAGQNRLTSSASGDSEPPADESSKQVPTISDIESSHHQETPDAGEEPSENKPQDSRLTLPSTMLAGNAKSDTKPQAPVADEPLDEAVDEQKDLLAEFEKIADELNDVLANLEGSTLVKRLKASSRKQQRVASKLATLVPAAFGASDREKEFEGETFAELAEFEATSSLEASHIMDDMAAYFDRSRLLRFQTVLDDMRDQDVTAALRQLGDDLRGENGLSISQAEYWSETFDRWAEDLVEVTQGSASPGGKAKGSLPPSIVLDVLQLLDGEVQLREQTRVAEQARPAVSTTDHSLAGEQLSLIQNGFQQRMVSVVERISELPDAQADFAKELQLLTQVSEVMAEATEILVKPETGPPAIAVETEIIELLLESKRFNPSGGGGASSPGGGGSGDTETPALALVGSGVNDKEVREDMSATQSTGTTGPGLPEEFRSGLDQYFNRLESWKE